MTEETIKKIQTLEQVSAAVEWEYPLDYAIAVNEAIEDIRKLEEIKEHVDTLRNFNQHNVYIDEIKEILR